MTEKILNKEPNLKTKESLFWNTFLPGIYQIFRFAISIIIARLLHPRDFGIIGIASIIIFYANSLTNFGFGTALIQKKEINAKHIDSVFSVNLAISSLLAILSWLLSGALATFFEIPELKGAIRALSAIFIITAFYSIPVTLLRRDVSFKIISKIEFLRGLCQSLVTLTLAYLGKEYWALIGGLLCGNLFGATLISFKVAWKPRLSLQLAALKEIFNFASWNFVASQMRLLGDYVDKFIIGKFLGPVQLGFYEKAFNISFMPVESIALRIAGVMFSSFSRLQDNASQLLNQLYKATATTATICIPLLVGLMSIADPFVLVLLGDKWQPMVGPFRLLLLSFIIASISNNFSSFNLACGGYKKQISSRLVCVVFLIILCLFAARNSIEAVAIAVVSYNLLLFLCSIYVTRSLIDLSLKKVIRTSIPAIIGSLVMYVVVKALSSFLLTNFSFVNLFLLAATGTVAYILTIMCIDYEEIRFLKADVLLQLQQAKKKIF